MIPERKLARAVLAMAFSDAVDPKGLAGSGQHPDRVRWHARAFLYGDTGWLPFWCEIAGLSTHWIQEAALRRWPRRAS